LNSYDEKVEEEEEEVPMDPHYVQKYLRNKKDLGLVESSVFFTQQNPFSETVRKEREYLEKIRVRA
jgi:hypothetical protein